SGPMSLVLAAGQKMTRLPPQLECATHALLWPWDEGPGLARVKASGLFGDASVSSSVALVEAPLLLAAINEILAHTALMVQPINVAAPLPPAPLASPAPPTLAPDASAPPDPSLLPAAAAAAAAATSASRGQVEGAGAWGAFDDVDKSEGGLVASLAELTGWGEGGWLGGLAGGGGGGGGWRGGGSQQTQDEGVTHGGGHSGSVKGEGMMGAAAGVPQQPSVNRGREEVKMQGAAAHGTSSSGLAGQCRKEGGGSATGPEGTVVDVPLPLPRALRECVRASVPSLARYWDNGGGPHPALEQQQLQAQAPQSDSAGGMQDLLGDDVTPPVPFSVPTKQSLQGGGQESWSSPARGRSGVSSRGRSSTDRPPQAILLRGMDRRSGLPCEIAVARDLLVALEKTGLSGMVGYLRTARVPGMVSHTAATTAVPAAPPPPVHPKVTPCTPPPSAQPSAAQVQWTDQSQGGGDPMWHWASADCGLGPMNAGDSRGPPKEGSAQQILGSSSAKQHGQQDQAGGAAAEKEEVLQMGGGWVPVAVQLGVPLYSLSLCKAVCKCAWEQGALSQEGREAQVLAQCMLQTALQDLISQFAVSAHGTGSSSALASAGTAPAFAAVSLPTCNLYFDGTNVEVVDLQGSLQRGGVSWCC
ncbi:hypothetical protein DUNSADRAFT_12115, partial [Dunaliella salina]